MYSILPSLAALALGSSPQLGYTSLTGDDAHKFANAPSMEGNTPLPGVDLHYENRVLGNPAPTNPDSNVQCGVDKYYWGAYLTKHFCVECPKGFVSDGCNSCAPDPEHRACVQKDATCQAGKFFSVATAGCAWCPAGKFQTEVGQRSCMFCPPGKFHPPHTSNPDAFGAGNVFESSITCQECPKGKFSDKAHSAITKCHDCSFCEAGSYGTTMNTNSKNRNACMCQDCSVGRHSDKGETICHNCLPGQYSSTGRQCTECAMGTFQPSSGAEGCIQCPDDYYSNLPGSSTCTPEPAKTIIFRAYGYKHKEVLASKGWKLLTAKQFPLFQSLLLKDYRRREGLQVLVGFSTDSCCMSVDDGLRVTATTTIQGNKKVSFVYPFEMSGLIMRCDATDDNQYDAGERLKLKYHSGKLYKDISTAESLGLIDIKTVNYGTGAAAICASKDDENNPGIYVGTLDKVEDRSDCEEIQGEKYCLEPPPKTRAPTQVPTLAPTRTPTDAPTLEPEAEDCSVTTWSFWSACSSTCGMGNQTRTRSIIHAEGHGGAQCPPLFDSRLCEMEGCENDCTMTTWSAWTRCSVTCGGGQQHRQRSMIESAKFGGRCFATDAVQSCNTVVCPVDCEWGDYGNWGSCSATCGLGKQMRRRDLKVMNEFDGKPCDGAPTEYQDCNILACPTDCEVGAWKAWTACGSSCGFGTQYRMREPIKLATHGGRRCPARSQHRFCHSGECPKDCKVSKWGDWSGCSKTCGAGSQTKTRFVIDEASHGGKGCPILSTITHCEIMVCPENCKVTDWGLWSECSQTCGVGSQLRERKISRQPGFGGNPCPTLDETRLCDLMPCPVHCEHELWGEWSACSKSCGIGTQTHSRTIKVREEFGGTPCHAPLTESQACKLEDCALDCSVGEWMVTSPCSKSCGAGWTKKTRQVVRPAKAGGAPCPALTAEHECNAIPCPVDCEMSEWSEWSECSVSCGPGSKTRTRRVAIHAAAGGAACSDKLEEVTHCMHLGMEGCPVDCEVAQWSEWSRCSVTCEAGRKKRTRQITHPPAHGGMTCPPLMHAVTCLVLKNCPVSCVLASWSAWPTECPGNCGVQLMFRHRKVLRAHRYGGAKCGLMINDKMCRHKDRCIEKVDCQITQWSPWGACSTSCGTGTSTGSRSRKRTIISSQGGGKACPTDAKKDETKLCNNFPCPADCTLLTWTPWSQCTKSCNGGTTSRSRKLVKEAQNGGKCHIRKEAKGCNLHQCPIDCIGLAWGEWSACTVTCGSGGKRTRSRKAFSPASHGGQCITEQHKDCALVECPIQCTITTWSNWGECSKSCGIGVQARKRTLLTFEGLAPLYHSYNEWSDTSNGGALCPPLENVRECHGQYYHTAHLDKCGSVCAVEPWEQWSDCTKSCDEGTQMRIRKVSSNPHNAPCPELENTRKCNMGFCSDPNKPIDCEMSGWGNWRSCSLMVDGTCSRKRTRSVLLEPRNDGRLCSKYATYEECNDQTNKLKCSAGSSEKYVCSHVTCEYKKNRSGQGRVVVLHHNHETVGHGHLCAYSEDSHSCTCLCSHDLAATAGRRTCQNYMQGLTHLPCNNHEGLTSQQLRN